MLQKNPQIVIDESAMKPVVERLATLYEAAGARMASDGEVNQPVWCIGETLAACGGYDLMWLAFQMTERIYGTDAAGWVDRSWDGIAIPGVVLWAGDYSSRRPDGTANVSP